MYGIQATEDMPSDQVWVNDDRPMTPEFNYVDMRKETLHGGNLLKQSINDIGFLNNIEYQRVQIDSPKSGSNLETSEACKLLEYATQLRDKYLFTPNNYSKSFNISPSNPWKDDPSDQCGASEHIIQEKNGVWFIFNNQEEVDKCKPISEVPSFSSFAKDLYNLMQIVSYGPCKTFCFERLQLLESKFRLHVSLNEQLETNIQKAVPHRDFYNVRKVDGHVHHSSSMNQKHLLQFIKKKLRDKTEATTVPVINRDGTVLTLAQVFETLHFTDQSLSVDTLDVHVHNDSFQRFDKFNLKYNPCGQSRLREIFLKTDNFIKGKYLAELTAELIKELENTKYQCAEWRISIYGRNENEWNKLAHWLIDNNLHSKNVRWLIQVPRLYNIYRSQNDLSSYLQFLSNVFKPLFEVTKNPSSNLILHRFLRHIVGFDTVDDESKLERIISKGIPSPAEWVSDKNPPYDYYLYYLYANLYSLNKFREAKGFNTFAFRPHSGEAGEFNHLASAFLLSTSINHGIILRKTPVLQYLYYLKQIGLAMSPLSNNALFLNYSRNPFPEFFARGLNVALSSDDPLQFHYSREPLIEEYSIAKAVWKFSSCDLSEMARNSVLQSGFGHKIKIKWLGDSYWLPGVPGNDIRKTNIPNVRVDFRQCCLTEEWEYVTNSAADYPDHIPTILASKKLTRW